MVFVRDVMTKQVIVADPDCSILDAAKKMASKKIGGLIVVEFGRPIGLLTERDILWKVTAKEKKPRKVTVREVMASPVITVSPLATLRAAARIMLDHNVRRLVVTRLDEVEGIVTARDLTEGFLETWARARKGGHGPS
ncbi:MAG TPA: CBS domain-containing protein [Thermoplasmata archaeon]|nr:CBS domain-containing protein [Thermoplasmata archaeon]